MTNGKNTRIPQRNLKTNHPKKLQTNNMPTNNVENTNDTNLGGDLLLVNKPRNVTRK